MMRVLLAWLVFAAGSAWGQANNFGDSGLIGPLEAPAIVTDTAQWPKAFHEAPGLADLVKQGKLPPG